MASYDMDVDNVGGNDHTVVAGTTELRYGRLQLQNAFGSELIALPMPLRAQYYMDASTGFVTNADDSCTAISTLNFTLSNTVAPTSVLGALPRTKNVGTTNTTATANVTMTSGNAGLSFSAPGTGGEGYVDVSIDLSAMIWLRYNWDGAGGDDDPSGRATFGIYKGNSKHIYIRERY